MVAHHGRGKKQQKEKVATTIIYKHKKFCIFSKMKATKKLHRNSHFLKDEVKP